MKVAVDGRKIAAFGATAKACTLIHNCGIAENIAYIVDNTPAKQGRYLPGTSIEIKPESALDRDNLPVLLTAWNYAPYIRSKYPDKAFIIPFVKMDKKAA